MQPLTNVFPLDILDQDPELDEEKKQYLANIGKYCKLAFPRKNLKCGYDLVVVHKERDERPNISESGKRVSQIVTNQLGRIFYCVNKDCLLKRHPYFWKRTLFMRKDVSVKLSNKYFQHLKVFQQLHFKMGRIV